MTILPKSLPGRLAAHAGAACFLTAFATRLALLARCAPDAGWDLSLLRAIATGIGFDFATAVFAMLPWSLLGALLPSRLLHAKATRYMLMMLVFAECAVLAFISVAEWFFWSEFGARFNFISVDYLVWTQEVWGNLAESYPLAWILIAILSIAAGATWMLEALGVFRWMLAAPSTNWRTRSALPLLHVAIASALVAWVQQPLNPPFSNPYQAELAKNGCWSFFAAFRQMELDYLRWYVSLPTEEANRQTTAFLNGPDPAATSASAGKSPFPRHIQHPGPERRWNVVTICMESMSADFLGCYGNSARLTPNLDRIASNSLWFSNLYATGTRTVRGMEALTLQLPPTPGQAIFYRPEGHSLVSSFTPFTARGYDCAFFYGGDGRFDFMNRFFSTAGCRIMDVNAWNRDDITFRTSWGACDGDLFRKTIIEADKDFLAGKPFHFFCMTTSNHRPYDFPSGAIDLPSHSGRLAAVKYADWAVGHLIDEASKHPWFNQTLFVFCADHCASSAGKVELDVTKFHIPAMVYAPGLVQTRNFTRMCSQIDVMPTVFGLLGWTHESLGFGQDLLEPASMSRPERAFVSNYQKIALLTPDHLMILKPNRQVTSALCNPATGALEPDDPQDHRPLLRETAACYQSASNLFSSGALKLDHNQASPTSHTACHVQSDSSSSPVRH